MVLLVFEPLAERLFVTYIVLDTGLNKMMSPFLFFLSFCKGCLCRPTFFLLITLFESLDQRVKNTHTLTGAVGKTGNTVTDEQSQGTRCVLEKKKNEVIRVH